LVLEGECGRTPVEGRVGEASVAVQTIANTAKAGRIVRPFIFSANGRLTLTPKRRAASPAEPRRLTLHSRFPPYIRARTPACSTHDRYSERLQLFGNCAAVASGGED